MARTRSQTVPFVLAALAVGCGASSPRVRSPQPAAAEVASTVEPEEPVAREVLTQLEGAGELPGAVLGGRATLGGTYLAASGRRCRQVRLGDAGDGERTLLACRDRTHWFFVPDVALAVPVPSPVAEPIGTTARAEGSP